MPMRMGGIQPNVPHTMELLQRPEVRLEIHLDLRQKGQMDELQNHAGTLMRQRMGDLFQKLRGLNGEQLQQSQQELRDEVPAMVSAFQGEMDEKVKAILRPAQIRRLHELDLQYRGPLSLADPKVADEAKLTNEHRAEILRIYNAYQAASTAITQDFGARMRANFQPGGPGAALGAPPPQGPGQQEIQGSLKLMTQKLEQLKKDAEAKVLEVLNEEEKQNWTAIQGDKFVFRKDQPTPTRKPIGN
jgi:hypothetical protein